MIHILGVAREAHIYVREEAPDPPHRPMRGPGATRGGGGLEDVELMMPRWVVHTLNCIQFNTLNSLYNLIHFVWGWVYKGHGLMFTILSLYITVNKTNKKFTNKTKLQTSAAIRSA